jgi:RimJ/RimL family protein N-acetyltransferase
MGLMLTMPECAPARQWQWASGCFRAIQVMRCRPKQRSIKGRRMKFELQPTIHNELIGIEPLEAADFEALYAVASDPLVWEQHPNKERYQRDVFQTFFKGAIESGGAFRVIDRTNGELIGSSRYYDLDAAQRLVCIGYTFIARSRWGGNYNGALKALMLDHAFRFVERVLFHIGVGNLRSRKALEKIGGVYIREEPVAYVGEPSRPNAVYKIDAADWVKRPRA